MWGLANGELMVLCTVFEVMLANDEMNEWMNRRGELGEKKKNLNQVQKKPFIKFLVMSALD